MCRPGNALLVAAILFASAPVLAEETSAPVETLAVTPSVPAAPAAPPVEVASAEEGLSARAQELSDIDADLALAIKRLQIGTTSVQQQEVDRKLGAVRSGVNTVPALVGVSGIGTHLVAEFLANDAIIRVRAGDWITDQWRVAALDANHVTLSRKGSRQTQTINFGHRPVSAAELARDMAELGRNRTGDQSGALEVGAPMSGSIPLPQGM